MLLVTVSSLVTVFSQSQGGSGYSGYTHSQSLVPVAIRMCKFTVVQLPSQASLAHGLLNSVLHIKEPQM